MNRPESMICETDSMISALRGELPRPTSSSGALVAGEQAVWQVFWLSADVSRLLEFLLFIGAFRGVFG